MIHRIVKMTFKESEVLPFVNDFKDIKDHILSFDGCESLKLLQDNKDHHTFFTYSEWKSVDDLDAYRNSPFFKTTWKKTKVRFADRPKAWSCDVVG